MRMRTNAGLAVALALLAACGQDATMPPLGDAGPPVSGDMATDSASADSVAAHTRAGTLEALSDSVTMRDDSIFKDATVIGYVVEWEGEDGTSGSGDVAPGNCYVILTIEKKDGVWVVVGKRIVYCVPEDPDDPGGGGGGTESDTLTVKLECDPDGGVERGTDVTCTLSADESSATFSGLQWSFPETGATQSGGTSWGGRALESGTMQVTGLVNGTAFEPAKAVIAVNGRGWSWQSDMNVRWADIECAGVNASWKPAGTRWGAAMPDLCGDDFFNRGDDSFSVGEGTGPWEGRFYVSAVNAPVAVSAQLAPVLTSGGSKHPLAGEPDLVEACGSGVTRANEHYVNTKCLDISGYKRMVTVVEQHEQGHLNDFAKVVGEHDIYAAWDAMIRTSRSEVVRDAKKLANDAHAEMKRLAGLRDPPSYAGWQWWLYRYGSYWDWAVHK